MALFSRGSKTTGAQEDPATPAQAPASDAVPASPSGPEALGEAAVSGDAPAGTIGADEAPEDAGPQVTISTTSYGGFGANATAEPAPAVPTGEAPASTETIPGLPDNVVLRAALAALGDDPAGHEILNVARQLFQGNVYLRIKGNAQELVNSGADLPLAIATRDDGQFVMVYSGGEALAAAVNADGDTETSAMGQAAPAVLQYVLQGDFAGIIVDHASSPASVVLPRALIERMFAEMDPALTLKRLVTGPRGAQTVGEVAAALASVPLWIAVNRASEDDDWGVAESRTETGERILPVFSHPLEVVALGRGDQPMPFEPAKLGAALRGDEGIDGVVIDPAGPWIRIDRADLGPVLALPEPEDDEADEDVEDAGGDERDAAADAAGDVDQDAQGGADDSDAQDADADGSDAQDADVEDSDAQDADAEEADVEDADVEDSDDADVEDADGKIADDAAELGEHAAAGGADTVGASENDVAGSESDAGTAAADENVGAESDAGSDAHGAAEPDEQGAAESDAHGAAEPDENEQPAAADSDSEESDDAAQAEASSTAEDHAVGHDGVAS